MYLLKHDNRLTALLTLKDRTLFTFRWMNYANAISFPFKVIIADGGSDKRVPEILRDKKRFANVDYEYIRYPHDRTFSDYYKKVEDALSRITTPYVVMVDNDDFYVPEGMSRAVDFLDGHPDYSTCRGEYYGFDVLPGPGDSETNRVYGEFLCHGPHYRALDEPSNESDGPLQRFKNCFVNWNSSWNNVQRTLQLREIWKIVMALDLKDIYLQEYLTEGLRAIAGKMKCDTTFPYYYRQYNVTGNSFSDEMQRHRGGNYYERMFARTWSEDIWKLIDVTAKELEVKEGMSLDEARLAVKERYQIFLSRYVLLALGAVAGVPAGNSLKQKAINLALKLDEQNPVRRLLQGINKAVFARRAPDAPYASVIRQFLANPPTDGLSE